MLLNIYLRSHRNILEISILLVLHFLLVCTSFNHIWLVFKKERFFFNVLIIRHTRKNYFYRILLLLYLIELAELTFFFLNSGLNFGMFARLVQSQQQLHTFLGFLHRVEYLEGGRGTSTSLN